MKQTKEMGPRNDFEEMAVFIKLHCTASNKAKEIILQIVKKMATESKKAVE